MITIVIYIMIVVIIYLCLCVYRLFTIINTLSYTRLNLAQREYDRLVELITIVGNTIKHYQYRDNTVDYSNVVDYYNSKANDLKYFLACNTQPINEHFNFEQFNKSLHQ